MDKRYREYRNLNLTEIAREISEMWQDQDVFQKSLDLRRNSKPFIFYEGPPSANGTPGIHHVMARSIKDIFCRYKTQKGFYVERKAGWDTHGLPVEIGVEKMLGITKEAIGDTITVEEYNRHCRTEVMRYKDMWDDLTRRMGYWVNLDDPYITFENKYIESIWWLLKELYNKGLLYKGFTIQPYSPAAGTGLSTHELNQPGCYRNVKDNTVVAQFSIVKDKSSEKLFNNLHGELFFLAWTTTPWTLPSNTGLAVGANITYVKVKTYNPYTFEPITVILAKDLVGKYFPEKNAELVLTEYEAGQKAIPFVIEEEYKGKELEGIRYEQLMPYALPETGDPFRVVLGDFVTTEDGTGIVHIAPSFGADDFKVGRQYGLGSLTLVDKQGRFTEEMGEFAGRFVKPEYDPTFDPKTSESIDIEIIVKLKKENRAFKTEKYEHSYPHCWRTDKPILYYPLDSWFIKTTELRDRMIESNKTINWKPESTGTGRFGNWLENLVDWNLSRSRFWGTPLPVWRSEDGTEEICIGSVEELYNEIEKAVSAGIMADNPMKDFKAGDFTSDNYNKFDLHRPFVDDIHLVSPTGKVMHRESDLIDVWFDSGAMPYAQFHYPFEKKDELNNFFPADFIAEGVDQTRGWFFTLHAIGNMIFDSVAFKNVVSNGLVLDKNGNKMSKRLGNAVDPFETLDKFGPDATRWYMITNSQPWDNLKFDINGIGEVQRKLFGTLHNTYSFFTMYANIDGFTYSEPDVDWKDRPELDRWILSELNTLIRQTDECYEDYEPTRAGRLVGNFVDEHLSNWYVRLSRRRFWKGDYSKDKISAYQTLYTCLETLSRIIAPIAPFYADRLFNDLNAVTGRESALSVHLTDYPVADVSKIDSALEQQMELAQKVSSMVLSLRKKSFLRVRQPLQKIMIPLSDSTLIGYINNIRDIILGEVNVKELEIMSEDNTMLVKKIKADFKKLGARLGKQMKSAANAIAAFNQDQIRELERVGQTQIEADGVTIVIQADEVEITTEDIPGWVVASEGNMTVALDITVTEPLRLEGIARDLINRIQNVRKESGLEVTDRIKITLQNQPELIKAVEQNFEYICNETLTDNINWSDQTSDLIWHDAEIADNITAKLAIQKSK
ncbi:MAG: isoleucine--tRNA ligase [Sphingobacteriia bacterium]|nr:isoleucine--tRNA ligase [Sphingobacteriia bacterium]